MRDRILQSKAKVHAVEVPEWGGTVYVRQWTVAERQDFRMAYEKAEKEGKAADLVTLLVAMSVCDKDGKREFLDEEAALLKAQSAVVLDRVALEAMRFNGLLPESVEAAKND